MPIVNRFCRRLQLEERFAGALGEVLSPRGRKVDVSHAGVLCVLVRNLVVSRLPLYRFQDWVGSHVPGQLGLTIEESQLFQDDRVGNSLDWFFEADRATFSTDLVIHMVKEFRLDLSQIHNDTTSLTFSGEYLTASPEFGSPFTITLGNNKDHRGDLKQLVFSLCVARDGAVPVQHQVWDGNTADDNIHIETWDALRAIVGHPKFIYVGDCKLASQPNLRHIVGNGGFFVTVMPATHKEYARFENWIQANEPPWEELIRRPDPRGRERPDQVFRGYEDPLGTADGYRLNWIHSSEKAYLDKRSREAKIEKADRALNALRRQLGKKGAKTEDQIRKHVDEILKAPDVRRWLAVDLQLIEKATYKQEGPGRPGKDTQYRRETKHDFQLTWKARSEMIQWDSRMDGIFPLMTNTPLEVTSPKDVLEIYKFQPYLEKRHEQLKSVLKVVPMWLKSPRRIAAFLTVMFVALVISSLIEREIRIAMRKEGLESLPIYPEQRECQNPTAEKVLQLFEGMRRSRLFEGGLLVQTFWDDLKPVQRKVLRLLEVSTAEYGVD